MVAFVHDHMPVLPDKRARVFLCERRSKSDTKRRRFGIESVDERFSLSSVRGTRTAGYR